MQSIPRVQETSHNHSSFIESLGEEPIRTFPIIKDRTGQLSCNVLRLQLSGVASTLRSLEVDVIEGEYEDARFSQHVQPATAFPFRKLQCLKVPLSSSRKWN